MKTLLFSSHYPSVSAPTRGTYNVSRFGALSRYCDVRVIAPLPWWAECRRPTGLVKAHCESRTGLQASFPVYWSLPGRQELHASAMYGSLRRYVRRYRRSYPFDVLLGAWAYPDGVAAARISQELHCPFVLKALGSDINELPRRPGLRSQIQWALGQAQRVITVSDALRDRVLELGADPSRVVVHHNAVDGDRFAIRDRDEARMAVGLPLDRPIVGYVGNLREEKGVEVLVEAAVCLRRGGDRETLLVLVGGGPLEGALRSRIEAAGLGQQVLLLGRRLHDEIPQWMTAFDVLCLPSFREGCPNVVLEALASGRPVVASAVGGVPELLTPDNGRLVPPGDPSALAEALQEALGRSWGPEALRATVGSLSWEESRLALWELLQEVWAEWTACQAAAPVEVVGRHG